jgi:hypothetical protein
MCCHRRFFIRILGHRHLIDQTLPGRLKVHQHQGLVRFGFLQLGRDFTGL